MKKKLIASLTSAIITLLFCELILSSGKVIKIPVFYPNYYDAGIGWLPRPGAAGWNLESGIYVRKGPLGWNDSNIVSNWKKECVLNFFGDSMTEGAQFNSSENFSSKLEKILPSTAQCPAYRVNNFGLSGTGTLQQALLLSKFCQNFPATRSAIFIFLGNDLVNNVYDTNLGLSPGFSSSEQGINYIKPQPRLQMSAFKRLIAKLSDNSNLVRLFLISASNQSLINSSVNVKNELNDNLRGIQYHAEDSKRQISSMKNSLIILSKNAKICETKFKVFFIPTGEEIALGETEEVEGLKRLLATICEGQSIECIDLYPSMKIAANNVPYSNFYLSLNGHLNSEGHSIIAQILGKYYLDEGLSPA